jgi:hypothetical protein
MAVFKDITHINNFSEYLPLLNSCLIVELLLLFILYSNLINPFHLKKWYQTYKLNAIITDVFVLLIFLVKTVFFYKYFFSSFNILKFVGLAIFFQLFNETWFYILLINIPYGYNNLLDYFKDYTKELGLASHIGYSGMMIFVAMLSAHISFYSYNTNIIIFITVIYLLSILVNI